MDLKAITKNFSVALFAQGLSMLMGILTTLIVPKVLGVEEYGYWQLFIFYTAYVGLFHFGLCDGVYLEEGGKTYKELDLSAINSQFVFCAVSQIMIGLLLFAGASLTFPDVSREFVYGSTCVYLVVTNAGCYLGYVLQAIDRTKSYSLSVALNGVGFIVPLIVLLLLHVDRFQIYIAFYIVGKALALVYCAFQLKSLLRARLLSFSKTLGLSWRSMSIGVKLMISNLASTLIIGFARFVIDYNWSIQEFGMVSFALSMITFFLMFVSQASMVLFPALRKESSAAHTSFFVSVRSGLDVFLPVVYVLYFPMIWIIGLWLPSYKESFPLFAILLPLCVYNSKMDILGTTMLKVFHEEKQLLKINIVTMLISATGALIGAFIFKSIPFMLGAAVVAVILRELYTDSYVSNELEAGVDENKIRMLFYSVLFVTSTLLFDSWIALIISLLLYVFYCIINRNIILNMFYFAKKSIKK